MSTFNLIDVLNFYLILTFVVGTAVRVRNYRAVLGVILTVNQRWPNLVELAKQHRTVFLRWPTLLPIGLTLALMLGNLLASRVVWSEALVTLADLWQHWWALLLVSLTGGLMVFFDCKAIFSFGHFDRAALESDLEKAEHWLQSWQATAVRVFTFGLINPRQVVNDQVLESLVKASLVVNGQMWRWSRQIALRLAFGLALWLTWGSI